jgi:S1-C subfamily serine protease
MFVLFASALAAAQSSPTASAVASPAAASTSSGAIAEIPATLPPAPAVSPSNMVSTPPPQNLDATAPGNAGIPVDALQQQMSAPAPDSSTDANGSEIARYQEEQSGMPPQQLQALQQGSEGELTTPFGMELQEAKRSLKSGEDADGLLIVAVAKGSPAATAGLRPYSHTVHDAIAAAAMVGAYFSGGLSIVVIPAIDYMQVGESYDMIIGVDGSRVTNFLDFQDRIHDLQPGEVVYLSVLRDGKRIQLTMPVTTDVVQSTTN